MLSSICFMPASLTPQSLSALRSQHGFILGREYRRDVHPRRVVPAKERLVGLVGIVAVEPVDDFGRDFFVDRLGPFQRQWTDAGDFLIRLRAVGGSA